MNWLDYINEFLPNGLNVTENEIIINQAPTFFEQLGDILNTTSKRTVANYLLWRAVITVADTLANEMREISFRISNFF